MKSKRSSPKFSNTSLNILSNKYVLYASFFFAVVTAANYLLKNNFEAVAIFIIIGLLTTYFSKNMIVVLLTTTILTNFIVMFKNRSNPYSLIQEGMSTEESSNLKNKMESEKKSMEAAKKEMDDEKDTSKKADLEKKYKEAEASYNKTKEEYDNSMNSSKKDKAESSSSANKDDSKQHSSSAVGSENTVSMGAIPANEVHKPLNGKPSVKDGMSQLKPASIDAESVDPMMKQKVPGMATGYNAQKEQAYNTLSSLGGQSDDVFSQQTAMINNLKSIEPILNTAQNFLDKFENSSISKMFSGGMGSLPGMSFLTGGAGNKGSPAPVSNE